MDNLKIKATKSSPEISFDYENNTLEITGKSYPANIEEFYTPVFFWLKKYLSQLESQKVTVNVELIYFNSSTSMVLMAFFENLEGAVSNGKNIFINWICEEDDDDTLEYGEEFQEDFEKLEFNFVQKSV
ncbi:MAG: DUF1987 domain-containing protein [Deltaproteobacteria bacterium]|nr:MAG: DUF1987 domain-containing protein [Deltaproteobacteria bacterium]